MPPTKSDLDWMKSLRNSTPTTNRAMQDRYGARHRKYDINPDVTNNPRRGIYQGSRRPEDPPFSARFMRLYNKLHSWDLYVCENYPAKHRHFIQDTGILEIYQIAKAIKRASKTYKDLFRYFPPYLADMLPGQYEAMICSDFDDSVNRFIEEMAQIEHRCVAWFRLRIPKNQRTIYSQFSSNVHIEGTKIWRRKWQESISQVNQILHDEWRVFKPAIERWLTKVNRNRQDPFRGTVGALSYIGSTASGFKGPPKQHIRFDPGNFDVDANLKARPLAEYAMRVDGLIADRQRIFGRRTSIRPLITFCDEVERRLVKEVLGVKKDPDDLFDVAIITDQAAQELYDQELELLRTQIRLAQPENYAIVANELW